MLFSYNNASRCFPTYLKNRAAPVKAVLNFFKLHKIKIFSCFFPQLVVNKINNSKRFPG